MHYYALAVIPEDAEDVKAAVSAVMEPHEEDWDAEPHTGFWDWWVIGGRYTGRITGYDPRTDPGNYSPCVHCQGAGVRLDEIARDAKTHLIEITEPRFSKDHPRYGETGWCNGCDGKGMSLNFSLRPYGGDVGRVKDVQDRPYTLITPEAVTHRENWDGDTWIDNQAAMDAAWAALEPNARVVVVDYHS